MSERDIRKLLDLVAKHLGKSWVEISDYLRGIDQNSLDAIEARLVAYDYAGVVAEVESAARRFAADTHSQFVRSGQEGARWLDGQIDDKLIRFDITNTRAVRAAQQNELELVYGMTNESRVVARNVIAEGQRAGLNPRTIARDLRDSIGLNPVQERAVRSYRAALESGQWSNALGRELSDGRGDKTVRRMQRDDGTLTEQQVDSLVERYRQNQLTYRAEVVARTESAKNVHAGLHEAFSQAIDRGDVEADQLVREWIAGPRTKDAREQHQEMDGDTAKWGEAFTAPDGTKLMYPGYGPPEHSINCRCTVATTLA